MNKVRLDILLVERGFCESRERARAVIMSGSVFVNGNRAEKPGIQVDSGTSLEVRGGHDYVSRGGLKLEKALRYFNVSPKDRICVDCGASTGGFTDCLLKNGARLVYAIDVGYGQLAWSIRSHARVVTMERTNIRYVTADMFEIKPELAVIDVSFISLALVLPVVRELLVEDGEVLCLIKPQFEAGRGNVGKKGVVRDANIHKAVLEMFIQNVRKSGFYIKGLTYSPLKGPEGNIEYLGWLRRHGDNTEIDIDGIVAQSHSDLAFQEHNSTKNE